MSVKETKIRTASDLWTLVKIVGGVLCFITFAALLLAKNLISAIIILAIPILYALLAFFVIRMSSSAMVMNIISSSGIKNMRRGSTLCHIQWDEVGDFGVAETAKGIFGGKYIYLSRIFPCSDKIICGMS